MITPMVTGGRRALAGVALATAAALTAGCGPGRTTAGNPPTTPPASAVITAAPPPPSRSGRAPATNHQGSVPTVRRSSSPSTATPEQEHAALDRVVAVYPPRSSATSGVVPSGAAAYAAVAHDTDGGTAQIDIYAYQDSTFVDVSPNIGANQNLDPVDPTTIKTGAVTGGPFPDFLVPLKAGDHDNGVLVANVGGTWQLIGVSDRTGVAATDELVQPNIVGDHVTQSVNDCTPDCAQGGYSVTTYLFDPQLGKLTAFGPTVQSPTPDGPPTP
jgi:hypothetical protein